MGDASGVRYHRRMAAEGSVPSTSSLDAFARELDLLEERIRAGLSESDRDHLGRIEGVADGAWMVGALAAPFGPNVVSMAGLSLARTARWTMVAHHVLHGGYDDVPEMPVGRSSASFARGRRRVRDFRDWLLPEAWCHEHNKLHHYRLNEAMDPDLVERNLDWLRESSLPLPVKYAIVGFFACTWRASYYAPNTLRVLLRDEARREARERGEEPSAREPTLAEMFREPALYTRCFLPYVGSELLLPVYIALPFGPGAAVSALVNSLGAEVLTNLHTFVVITTNHAGHDVEAYDAPIGRRGKGEFYRRQVMGSVNFETGGFVRDFLHGYLNYQIEHHLFPDLPMAAYARMQPEVRAICERHGVPYKQEGVFTRLKKTLDVMVGRGTMLRAR